MLKAPFPYFGGKSRVAHLVWDRFGNVPNYVEPFFGSGAVLLERPHPPGTETVNDLDCVSPSTRILKSDLTWTRAGEIKVGDALVGFDESNGEAREGLRAPKRYRRLADATVTGVRTLRKPSYRLTFDDGTTVIASADHLWLGGSHRSGGRGWRWVKTENMVCNRATQRTWVLKVADVVEREESWEAGWLAGLMDGEGSLVAGPGLRVCISQNGGNVLDSAERMLRARGFQCARQAQRKCQQLVINGGMVDTLTLLMRLRPKRLIDKLASRLGNVSLYGREHRAVGLVSKEFLGVRTVIAIETDTRTFIAEGLASHNCYLANFWRALQAQPEELAAWADWPVNEADLLARHQWLVNQGEFRERIRKDPEYFDCRIGGWWAWGLCSWIGSGWCRQRREGHQPEQLPHLGNAGMGINRKLPHLGNAGRGINRKLPHLGDAGRGEQILQYFRALSSRLRDVRVACGEWDRVLSPAVTDHHGVTGVFLDPPYTEGDLQYSAGGCGGEIATAVREWAITNGDNPLLRIALCGYEGEHAMPDSWECVAWKPRKGYQAREEAIADRERERIWFSRHCIKPPTLFDSLARCQREIDAIAAAPDGGMGATLGDADWRVEQVLIKEEMDRDER